MQRLLNNYPSLKNVEFHINEWGLCSHGDSKFSDKFPMLEYRNSEVSALFMVKLVHSIYAIEENYKFKTSMLLYWGSWFNAATGPIFSGSRDLMTSGNVPKPIYIAFEMLAKLGENRLKVIGPPVGGRFGMLATRSEKQIQLLVYNFDEQDDLFDKKDAIIINLEGLTNTKSVSISEIWLDRSHHNTYRKWEAMGKPAFSENIIST
jgi:hypothetical protein